MSLSTQHRIIGVKLVTMLGYELEPTADIEWSLDIWKADGLQTCADRVIGLGTLVPCDDSDFRPAA